MTPRGPSVHPGALNTPRDPPRPPGPPRLLGPSTPSGTLNTPRDPQYPQGPSMAPGALCPSRDPPRPPRGPSYPPGAVNTSRDPPHPPGALHPIRDSPPPPQGTLHFSRPSHTEKIPRGALTSTQPPWSPGPGLAASRKGKIGALAEGCGSVGAAWGETRPTSSGQSQERGRQHLQLCGFTQTHTA